MHRPTAMMQAGPARASPIIGGRGNILWRKKESRIFSTSPTASRMDKGADVGMGIECTHTTGDAGRQGRGEGGEAYAFSDNGGGPRRTGHEIK